MTGRPCGDYTRNGCGTRNGLDQRSNGGVHLPGGVVSVTTLLASKRATDPAARWRLGTCEDTCSNPGIPP